MRRKILAFILKQLTSGIISKIPTKILQ